LKKKRGSLWNIPVATYGLWKPQLTSKPLILDNWMGKGAPH
jgi:hypothetical protein